jgi:hypothetical protein
MPQTTSSLDQVIERFRSGERLAPLAREIGMPWQRLYEELRDAGLVGSSRPADAPTTTRRSRRRAQAATQPLIETMTFGIEIECTVPSELHLSVGGYHRGIQIPGLPAGWLATSDGSIRPGPGHVGVEIVSPVLQGPAGILQVLEVCAWLERIGAKVNASTGFHVHVGWRGQPRQLRNLVRLVRRNERALYASTGTRSREQGHYCQPISGDHQYDRLLAGAQVRCFDRYRTLNLTNLRNETGKRTVEFRVFSGTTSATKMIAFIRLALGLVEKAMGADLEGDADHPTANGREATEWLLGELGWGDGQAAPLGSLGAEGAPSIPVCADEVRRLAAKYDGE